MFLWCWIWLEYRNLDRYSSRDWIQIFPWAFASVKCRGIYAAPCAGAISSKCRRLRILRLLGHTEHSASKSRIGYEWFGAASGNKHKQISDRRGRALCDSLPFPYHDMDDGRGDRARRDALLMTGLRSAWMTYGAALESEPTLKQIHPLPIEKDNTQVYSNLSKVCQPITLFHINIQNNIDDSSNDKCLHHFIKATALWKPYS